MILINATLSQFTIIGKAITHLDTDILLKYNYPWYKIKGLRNFILHEYHSIEYKTVFKAIQKDLPELKSIVEQIIELEC